MQFIGCQFELATPHDREGVIRSLRRGSSSPLLLLNTCQRLEAFGFSIPDLGSVRAARCWKEQDAFERLARIAAGLESRILGELEVLGQVRAAYKDFHFSSGASHTELDRVFQDALSLAREARRESGIDKNQTSLSALAAREIMSRIPATDSVAVVGSGSLAGSVARYLTKRGKHPVRVSSRCPENALTLAMEVGGFGAGLDQLAHLLAGVSGIITATAAPHPVVYAHHLHASSRPLVIVDLGVPPDVSPEVRAMDGITYIPLADIEAKAQINSDERRARAEVAARIIRDGARAWAASS
jgi:glutamyl-tRNA reductase